MTATADYVLTQVNVRFDTHDDNKDWDTTLNVLVKNQVNIFLSEEIAEGLNLAPGTEFVDPSTHSFDLTLKTNTLTIKDLTLPVTNIHIQPNGNDRWIFDFKVSLVFTDPGDATKNKTFSAPERGIILDQNNKDRTILFRP